MKIGFDAKRATQNSTGLGNYSRFVLGALATYAQEHEYLLYTPTLKKAKFIGLLPDNSRIAIPKTLFWKTFTALWRVWGVTADIQKEGVALYHGLSNELPLNLWKAKGVKSIVTIHDLIFLKYPAYYRFFDRKIYTYKFRKACQQADRIIAVSECTKRDIMTHFHIPAEKIDVVYQGSDTRFKERVSAELKERIRQKYQLPEHYILYVGSIEKRKNLQLVAEALKQMQQPIPVIAVGKRTPYADTVETYLRANKLEGEMRLLSNVPFEDLPALYQLATTFVYPSLYEGFGIPILEALNSGVPVVGATGSCLEEAGGPHSLYVDPSDSAGLAQAIERTWNDTALRQKMIQEGFAYAKQFDMQQVTPQLLAVYKKAIGDKQLE